MILPLGDAPNPRGVPVVTYAIILANVAVYLLVTVPLSARAPDPSDPVLLDYLRVMAVHLPRSVPLEAALARVSAYDLFLFAHGFRPSAPSVPALFYSVFLHAGLMHLAGNMLFLWIYGGNVEHRLGPIPYLLAYLGTGIAATLFHAFFALGSPLPLVGASGAISGVLGFYFLWFPRNRVRLLVFLFPFLVDVIFVPARLVLGLYLLVDNLLPFLVTRGTAAGGVAYGAHIGGFAAGLVIAKVMDKREGHRRPHAYGRTPGTARAGASGALHEALVRGDFESAAETYFSLDPRRVRRLLVPEETLALAAWLYRNGHAEAALAVYRYYLRDYPGSPGAAEAHLGVGLIQLESLGQATPAYQHFLDALDLNPAPEIAARARAGLAAIEARQKRPLDRLRR